MMSKTKKKNNDTEDVYVIFVYYVISSVEM
jgi:hypothetical protein